MRLLNHVEGETEETFTNELLRPHLIAAGYHSVAARLLGNARLRVNRGGVRSWTTVKRDIINHLRQDEGAIATTMVDFYGLPSVGTEAWPGRAAAAFAPHRQKPLMVEEAMRASIDAEMGSGFNRCRFVPFVVMHEFEGLLFSETTELAAMVGRPALAAPLRAIRDAFATPEEIDDSPQTAPSKRILSLVPGYQKPLHGNLAALQIGLPRIRHECPHFHDWLTRLEAAPGTC